MAEVLALETASAQIAGAVMQLLGVPALASAHALIGRFSIATMLVLLVAPVVLDSPLLA